MSENSDFNYLVDVSSVVKADKEEDTLKDIVSADYEFFGKYIDDLYFIEANMVYMNYVCNVPQSTIADIFNMRQYGVSKRIYSAFRRLAIRMKAPDSTLTDSYNFLKKLIPNSQAYILVVWYSLKTVTSVAKTAKVSGLAVTQAINNSEDLLNKLYEAKTQKEFKRIIGESSRLKDIDIEFLNSIRDDMSEFYVVKHKIKNHLTYIKELQEYNSRGSHSFRKEWEE